MKPSREEWSVRLENLISNSGYVLTNVKDVEVIKPPTYKELKQEYKKLVKRLTEVNKHTLEGIENRGWDNCHIDHKISIHYGFVNGIPAESIAHTSNLRVISKGENCLKGIRNIIDEDNDWILNGATNKNCKNNGFN